MKVLAYELKKKGLTAERQKPMPIMYDNIRFDEAFRSDVVVNGKVIAELKSVEALLPVHADEHFIVDFARVNNRGMADGDQFAYVGWETGVNVDGSIVLNVRARPDDDAVDITAQDCAVPDARFFFKNYVTEHSRAGNNPRAGMDGGTSLQSRDDAVVSGRQ